jgi:outer membrane protein
MRGRLVLASLLAVALAPHSARAEKLLTLAEALQTAREHQPQLLQARANTSAAVAQALQARSGLLPQIGLAGAYQRTTANFVPRPGFNPQTAQNVQTTSNFDTFDFYNFGLTANQLVYDFGQTTGHWHAAQAQAGGTADTEKSTLISILQGVRVNFFAACATKALVDVAAQTLDNQEKHLRQIEGFVDVGTRPEIDLAQGKTDVANAKVSLINAQNQYAIAKAQLNQAMGVEGRVAYDVKTESLPPVDGEDTGSQVLFEEAAAARPDLAALVEQRRAQELTLDAFRGAYGPSIGVSTGMTDAGGQIANLGWNWNAGVTVTWPLYQGGLTDAQVSQAKANLVAFDAQISALRQAILVQVQQARLTVVANRESLKAAEEALVNATQRLRLAEGRYETGVGSVIELGDAQVALTNAAAQKVQAEFNLATARANLIQALGRE